MKTRSQTSAVDRFRQHAVPTAFALAMLLGQAPVAHAEHLKPDGLFSEAKLDAPVAPQVAPVNTTKTAVTAAAVPASAISPVQRQPSLKQWARSQYHAWRDYFKGNAASSSEPAAIATAPPPAKVPLAVLPVTPPAVALEKSLRAPASVPASEHTALLDAPGVVHKASGLAVYDVANSPTIPRLTLEKEERYSAGRYALDARMEGVMNDRMVHELESPALLSEAQIKAMNAQHTPPATSAQVTKDVVFGPKGKIDRTSFDAVALNQKPEAAIALKKFVPLTADEVTFLSGLLLFQQGERCPSALGLFHKLAKLPAWQAESNYYLAMCSKKLSLDTDFHERAASVLETKDVYYSRKIMAELSHEVPYEVADDLGNALMKATSDPKVIENLKPETRANVAYLLADWAVTTEHFTTALTWAKQVPKDHPKFMKAQFLLALAEYQAGSKENATKIEDLIVNDKSIEKSNLEFQALVALNAARMNFQEQKFKDAHEYFLRVYKDHPLWLESLTEMGWSQLMDGDFEGAIGNMYSVQSPFFQAVYKPESYVIRTIGYLNLCQYGDAYKTLSILEHDYRPYLDRMEKYLAKAETKPAYYQTVKDFMTAPKKTTEVDGLPMPIVREMARHRDFTNMQKAFNRLIDERPNYAKVNDEVEVSLKAAQAQVNSLRKVAEDQRKHVAFAVARHDAYKATQLKANLEKTLDRLNDAFFKVDLYSAAKLGMDEYRKEVIGGADRRIVRIRGEVEHLLANRLLRMKVDLARMLDNNELLRYEVFAGSGENIRYQVAGGEVANRIPATTLPKSKSLQWDFDGEYWEDEIGHYRSSLKNNCPKSQQATASLDGGVK